MSVYSSMMQLLYSGYDKANNNPYQQKSFNIPMIKSNIQNDDIDAMIIRLREEIIEKAIEKTFEDFLNSKAVPFFTHCLKQAWRRLVNWSSYRVTNEGGVESWLSESEPDCASVEPCCFGIIPQKEKEDLTAKQEDQEQEEPTPSHSSQGDEPHEVSLIVQKKKKRMKRKRKKTMAIEEVEKEVSVTRSVSKSFRSHPKSTYTRSYTSSVGWGDYRESIKRKYVKQLAKFISPKYFQKQVGVGSLRVHAPSRVTEVVAKNYKQVVINVKDLPPEAA